MARRSRRSAPDPEDYLPEEDEFDEEEEDEEPPRHKRRRPRDEEEEDRPRRRRSRGEEDDDEEEEERPRRRRRSRDEDDEEPRRRRRSRDDDEDDDEEEDDEPRRSKKARGSKGSGKKSRTSNRNSGWDAYDREKARSSDYADKIVVKNIKGEVLLKFLSDAPDFSYSLHWFDEMKGRKGWMCLKSADPDADCPACDMGDRPMPNACFNVLVLDEDGDWNLKVLVAGKRLTGQIHGLSEGRGGLSGPYWSLMAGPDGSGTGNFQRVKDRDLDEDWDVEPLTEEELDDWIEDAHVLEDVEQIPSRKDLVAALREIED